MIKIGDLILFEVPVTARNMKVSGLNVLIYNIGVRESNMKAPFNIGTNHFEFLGHLEDIKKDKSLLKKMLFNDVLYDYNSTYVSWEESIESWLKFYNLIDMSNKLAVARYSKIDVTSRYFETLPKKALKWTDTDIKFVRMIPGKRNKYKKNKYGIDILVNGKKIVELNNFEAIPNIYYILESDSLRKENKVNYYLYNSSKFIADCNRDNKNPVIEITNFTKIWKNRIYILQREDL